MKTAKNSINLTEPTSNITNNGRRLYCNHFTNLNDIYLVILNINIKLISTLTLIFKYLIVQVFYL